LKHFFEKRQFGTRPRRVEKQVREETRGGVRNMRKKEMKLKKDKITEGNDK
jgi:hypothetical protein